MKKNVPTYIAVGCGGVLLLCACWLAFSIARNVFVFITPDQRGVVISALEPTGYRPEPLGPGLHWIVPFAENVRLYPIARQTYVMSMQPIAGETNRDDSVRAITQDGLSVDVSAFVDYAIDADKVIDINLTWQDRYQDYFVRPLVRGMMRDMLLHYTAADLGGSKRAEFERAISEQLRPKFAENDLRFIKFTIEDVSFR